MKTTVISTLWRKQCPKFWNLLKKKQTNKQTSIRLIACAKFVSKITPGNPLHPLIHSRIIGPSSRYNLRPKAHTPMATKTDRFGGLVSVKYAPALIS